MNSTLTMPKTATFKPLIVAAREGRWLELGDHRGTIAMSSHDTGDAFALFALEIDHNGGTPPHIHTREEETFFIQEGRFAVMVGEQTLEAGPGDTIFGPRGTAHAWRCISEEGGKMLIFVTPGKNFETFACEMASRGIIPLDPESIAQLVALADGHGIEILPPPL